MPYITSSIILQLLQVAVPSLEKLSKEGGGGAGAPSLSTRRYLTVGPRLRPSPIGYVFLFHTPGRAKAGESVGHAFRRAPHLS